MFKKFLRLTFDFFASLKLAVFLLITLAVTLASGTILESLHGAKAAQQVVYHSPWFNGFLGVLGINVAAAALDRLPWQRRHIGFLLTHAGILLVLLGSWMTHRFAIDGELALAEGEKSSKVTLEEPLLQVVIPGTDQGVIVPLKPTPFRWEGRRPIPFTDIPGLQAYMTAYYPHAEPAERVLPQRGGKPAAHVALFNQNMKMEEWLLLGVQDHEAVNLGPAMIRFAAHPVEGEKPQDFKGALILQYNGKEITVPVNDALGKPWPVPETSYTLEVKRFLPHAMVEKGRLINQSDEQVNPACEIVLRSSGLGQLGQAAGGLEEFHTVFSRFPDFPTIHGLKPSRTDIKIRYDFPEQTRALNELRLFRNGEGKLLYQITTQGVPGSLAALEPGKEYRTGWMNLKFMVTDYYQEARYEMGFDARPMPAQGKAPHPAVRIQFESGEESHSAWFTRGDHQIFFLGGRPFHATCGLRSLSLDFDIQLKDFMIDYYPGTHRPASFKSRVVLEDAARGLSRATLISMNEPLEHRGFKIYQSGYQLGRAADGGPDLPARSVGSGQLGQNEADISVFAVGRDPGIPVKYTGSVVMILGIVIMFYMKKFSNTRSFYAES